MKQSKRTTKKQVKAPAEVRCPTCGGQQFVVTPRVIVELAYDFSKDADAAPTIEDFLQHEDDEVMCSNCEWEGRWSDVGK
jgi:DNA-directed RNA polymerase subunit RPC12/RpoP